MIGVVSEHLASVASEPTAIKFCLDGDIKSHLRLPQLVAVQSHDVVLEMSMYDAASVKAVRTGPNAPSVIILIGFPDKLITAPFAYFAFDIIYISEFEIQMSIYDFVSPGKADAAIDAI